MSCFRLMIFVHHFNDSSNPLNVRVCFMISNVWGIFNRMTIFPQGVPQGSILGPLTMLWKVSTECAKRQCEDFKTFAAKFNIDLSSPGSVTHLRKWLLPVFPNDSYCTEEACCKLLTPVSWKEFRWDIGCCTKEFWTVHICQSTFQSMFISLLIIFQIFLFVFFIQINVT